MNGSTLATIAPPGCVGFQARRATTLPDGVGELDDAIVARRRQFADIAQTGQLQIGGDFGEQTVVDIFCRDHDRGAGIALRQIGVGADRRRGDDGGFAGKRWIRATAAARFRRAQSVEERSGVVRHGTSGGRAEDRGSATAQRSNSAALDIDGRAAIVRAA